MALDFTKGILILLMVVYHWGNFFLGFVPYFYDLLRFLTPSFILITGSIVSMVYVPRYGLNDRRMYRRLLVRGTKLLLLFTFLNLAIHALSLAGGRVRPMGLHEFGASLFDIYVTGNSYVASFRILLPIAYLLLFSVGFLQVLRWPRSLVVVLAFGVCAGLQVTEVAGWTYYNLVLLSFGFLGLALDCLGFERINNMAARLPVVILCYAVYLGIVLVWGPLYWVQLLGVSLTLLLIYGIGLRCSGQKAASRAIVLVGHYSLLAYIAQIGFLQALLFIVKRFLLIDAVSIIALFAALTLTVLLVFGTELARKRSTLADKLYRLVFS